MTLILPAERYLEVVKLVQVISFFEANVLSWAVNLSNFFTPLSGRWARVLAILNFYEFAAQAWRKPLHISLLGAAVALSACSETELETPPHLLIPDAREARLDQIMGVWRVAEVAPGCSELLDFGPAKGDALSSDSSVINMRIRSRDEVLQAGYEQIAEFDRDRLEFNVKIDGGGVDCLGNDSSENFGLSESSLHQIFGPYYISREGQELSMYASANSSLVVSKMRYEPQDISSEVLAPHRLSLIELSPDSADAGQNQSFIVNIGYFLNEAPVTDDDAPKPKIEVGLNTLFRDDYAPLRTVQIEPGAERELLLEVSGEVLDWGAEGKFALRVQMFNAAQEEVGRVFKSISLNPQ